MKHKYTPLFVPLLCSLLLTGCSQEEPLPEVPVSLESEAEQAEASESEISSVPETIENTIVHPDIYYITNHGTAPVSDLSQFISELESVGYLWHEAEISDIPAEADMLIFNSPQEDLTKEEYQQLENYMNQGGDFLYLLPASESETRYKYLNLLSELFYIQIDYDIISETDKSRIQDDDSIQIQAVNYPERFGFYDESMQDGIVYMRNIRSFHMMSEESSMSSFMDECLETASSAVGTPYGGIQDDPITYENDTLSVMLYCRDELRNNAALIAVGSADFLLDEYYASETSQAAKNWVFSALGWFTAYERF